MRAARRLAGFSNTAAAIVVVVALAGGANVLAYRAGSSAIDLTEGNRLTLTSETRRVLGTVRHRLEIDAFLGAGTSGERDARALLGRFADANRRIHADVIDPDAEPGKARRLGITNYGTAVLRYQGRRVDIAAVSEIEVASAVLRLVRGRTPVACFVTGHGEAAIGEEGPSGLSRLAALATRNGFAPKPVSLAGGAVDPSCGVVVVAGPRVPFPDGERDAVIRYLKADGKVLLLVDGLTTTDVNPFTKPWGVDFLGGVVVDAGSNLNNDATTPIIGDFPTANQVVDGVPSLLVPAAAGLRVATPDPRPGLFVNTLARTSAHSLLSVDPEAADQSGSLPGPIVVAAGADFSGVRGSPPVIHRTRLLVVAGVGLAHNAFIDNLGNATFLANGLSWLAQDELLLTIGSRPPGSRPLTVSTTRRNQAVAVTVVGMPGALLAAALAVFLLRRRR